MVILELCFIQLALAPQPLCTVRDKEIERHETTIVRRARPNNNYMVRLTYNAFVYELDKIKYSLYRRNGVVPKEYIDTSFQLLRYYTKELEKYTEVDYAQTMNLIDLLECFYSKYKKAFVMKEFFLNRSQNVYRMLVKEIKKTKREYKYEYHLIRHAMWCEKMFGGSV